MTLGSGVTSIKTPGTTLMNVARIRGVPLPFTDVGEGDPIAFHC
jgi:hypothetical protein